MNPKQVVEVLNRALESDREAVESLFAHRVSCNRTLADDPTIQVLMNPDDGTCTFSTLGLINGIIGIKEDGWGYIAAIYNVKCRDHGEERLEFKESKVGEVCPIEGCTEVLSLGSLVKFDET